MTILFECIYNDRKNRPTGFGAPPSWHFQVLQDVISVALDIPLQLFAGDSLKKFWWDNHRQPAFLKEFPKFEEFKRFASEVADADRIDLLTLKTRVADHLPEEENRFFTLSRASNKYALISMFRQRSTYWRWRDLLWTLDAVERHENASHLYLKQTGAESGVPKALMNAQSIRLDEFDLVLLAGPVWLPASRPTGQAFHDESIEAAIRLYTDASEELNAATFPRVDHERLVAAGHRRFPFLEQDLKGRAENAVTAFRAILNLEVIPESFSFRRCDYVHIAEWVCAMLFLDTRWKGQGSPYQEALGSAIRLARSSDGSTEYWLRSDWPSTPLGQGCAFQLVERKSLVADPRYDQTRTYDGDLLFLGELSRDDERDLILNFERQLLSIDARRNGNYSEDTNLLRDMLDDEFASLAPLVRLDNESYVDSEAGGQDIYGYDSTNGEFTTTVLDRRSYTQFFDSLKSLTNVVCRHIQRRLLSDICTVYYYDHVRQILEMRGAYLDKEFDHEALAALDGDMRSIGTRRGPKEGTEGNQLRMNSITYRAVDAMEPQLVRSKSEFSGTDRQRPFVAPPDGLPQPESGIAVPMRFRGRVFGAVELIGRRPFHFRWNNKVVLSELIEVYSRFIFPGLLLAHFQELNREFHRATCQFERCQAICRHATRLLLASGCALWVRAIDQRDIFRCAGWYGRPDLDDRKSEISSVDFSASDASTITGHLISNNDQDTWMVEGVIGKEPFGGEWLKKDQNAGLAGLGMQTAAVIPLRIQDGTVEASLTVFKKDSEPYVPYRWRNLVKLLSYHLADLVEVMPERDRCVDFPTVR